MPTIIFCTKAGISQYAATIISLITTYSDVSSDKADNIGKKSQKKVEQETIISLNAPRAENIKRLFRNSPQRSFQELYLH